MRRTLPSEVVKAIEAQFPWTVGDWRAHGVKMSESRFYALAVMPGILKMIDGIPEELLTFGGEKHAAYTMATSALTHALERGRANENAAGWPMIMVPWDKQQVSCIIIIRDLLKECQDEAPSAQSLQQLAFIQDGDFRATLGTDIGSAERALADGEWKGASVLAGSVVEALLFWTIQQYSEADRQAAMDSQRG